MAITKQKGDIAEAFVTYLLKKNGFNILIPWGEDNRYDLVSEKNGIFKLYCFRTFKKKLKNLLCRLEQQFPGVAEP